MTALFARLGKFTAPAVVATALLLAGCQTPAGPVEVTRFHRLDDRGPIVPGTFGFAVVPDSGFRPAETGLFERAVTTSLQGLGFREAAAGVRPDYLVSVRVLRDSQLRADDRGGPVSVGVGGSTGSYGSGVGVGIGVNLGGGDARNIIAWELDVAIRRAADDVVLWEGRSSHRAREGAPSAEPGLLARRLTGSLFAGFPGQSGETVVVP